MRAWTKTMLILMRLMTTIGTQMGAQNPHRGPVQQPHKSIASVAIWVQGFARRSGTQYNFEVLGQLDAYFDQRVNWDRLTNMARPGRR